MIIPFEKLMEYDGNSFELTTAAIKRSLQLEVLKTDNLKKNQGKAVPTALEEILNDKISFNCPQ